VHGTFTAHTFHDLATGQPALAVTLGDVCSPPPLLARLHSSCITSEVYGGCDCDCVEQLDAALVAIARAGRGAVFYLAQEGRGAGLVAKARDRMMVQASGNRLTTFDAYAAMGIGRDARRYGAVAAACRLLGIAAPLRLLTDNPDKVAALEAEGLTLAGTAGLTPQPSAFNRHYLAAKARAGHTFREGIDHDGAAELPEAVTGFTPHTVPGAPRFVYLAAYLLPIRLRTTAWFRLHAYLDTATGRERIVLTHGLPDGARRPLVRLQGETLLERFPVRAPRLRRRWLAAAERIVEHGVGCALFLTAPDERPDEDLLGLVGTHLPAGRGRALVDGPGEGEVSPGATLALGGSP
jgi:3,4-dihydroxy 2-butanone 4-phosphate synthase / GTP cyclohydrolase II